MGRAERTVSIHPFCLFLWGDGLYSNIQSLGFSGSSAGKESACRAGDSFLGRKDPPEEGMAPVFLPGESHGQRHLAGYSPWHRKKSDTLKQPSMHAHRVLPMQSVGKHADFSSCNLWAL